MSRILFVGERTNLKVSNIPFDKNKNGCGRFIHQSIEYMMSKVYGNYIFIFDNIYKGNKLNKRLKIRQYSFDRIIALGVIAFKELIKMRISCVYVPHPAYFKRFRSKEGYEGYSYLLWEAINGR